MFKKNTLVLFMVLLFMVTLFLSVLQPVMAESNQRAFHYFVSGSVGPASGYTQLRKNPDYARPYIVGDIQNRHGQYIGGGANTGPISSRYVDALWQYIRVDDMRPYVVFGAHEAKGGTQYAGEVV